MLTIPTALWPYLLAKNLRPVEVYEIEAFAGRSTLYYSDQAVTWGGHDYVGLAIATGPVNQQMEFRVPGCDVTFSNVSGLLPPFLYPVDTLTGARLTVRLLLRDASNAVLTDSFILFKGDIEPPKNITEDGFTLSVIGPLEGRGTELPARRFALSCPWFYANKSTFDGGGNCSYQNNTLANGAGTATVTLIIDVASTFQNGDVIQIGGGAAVAISSGGGTTTLTLASARTWADNATVRYADCNRSRNDCAKRGMRFRFGGFPGVSAIARFKTRQAIRDLRQGDRDANREDRTSRAGSTTSQITTFSFTLQAGEVFADPATSVPVLYGRRRVQPVMIEFIRSVVNDVGFSVGFYALSEGEFDDIVRYYIDDLLGVDVVESSVKTFGIYFRDGDPGTNDTETPAEYEASPTTQLRAQNVDYRSLAAVAYSELGYVIFIRKETTQLSALPTIELDTRGVKVQKFTTAGATDGAKAWSDSPVWQFVDLCLSVKHGLGLAATDVDFSVTRPEADYAGELITGSEARTIVKTAQGTASKICKVNSTEGFIIGRRVDVATVANIVEDVVSDDEITLGTAVTQSVNDTVVQRPSRFESHLFIKRAGSASKWLGLFLTSCRGYVTYDGGKIQFRIERDICKERFPDGGLEVWASSTNLTAGTENLGPDDVTIHQDTSIKHSGASSLRIDRTGGGQFGGETWAITGFEPGRWYRLTFWHKQDALGIGSACRLRIRNTTQNLGVASDGFSWSTTPATDPIAQEGSTSFAQYEFTFKTREDFLATDSLEFGAVPYFTAGHSVWYDDFSLRGPYAGDFREFTTALNMGWKDGSFRWSLDRKDRETNRVAVSFINESGRFGPDEAVANDFTHQLTHQIKTIPIAGDCISDRDQAYRIAKFRLDKQRLLGPGCEFLGTPAALALQPGDVILVSATVPGWICKEQRVIETETRGLGDADQHFVTIRTEDYLESIYGDGGPPQNTLDERPSVTVNVTVTRQSGGVLGLSMFLSGESMAVRRYVISMADTNVPPIVASQIGFSMTPTFTYTMPVEDLDVQRYIQVKAETDAGFFYSGLISVTVFRADDTPSGYVNDFKFPTAVSTPSGWDAFSPATVGNVNDASDGTYNQGEATLTGATYPDHGTANGDDDAIKYSAFGTGTVTGRPYLRGNTAGNPGSWGSHKIYYTLDGTVGSPVWVLWQTITSATITDYFGPEITVDKAKFAMKAEVKFTSGGFIDRTITCRHHRVAFDQKA